MRYEAFLSTSDDTLYMLDSFVKKSAKTSRKDLSIARQRLKDVKERLQEERRHGQE